MMIRYESKIGKADTKGKSSRVIIPIEVMKLLNLGWGDKLSWEIDISGKGAVVTVTPKKE